MIGYVIYPLRELRAEIKKIFEEMIEPDEVLDQWLDDTIYELIYISFFGPNAKYSNDSVYDRMAAVGVDDASTQIEVLQYLSQMLSPIVEPVRQCYQGRSFIKFHLDPTKLVYEINPFHERTSPSNPFQAAPQRVG